MKANEIPEKIYVPTAGLEMTDKLPCHIEYTRTDAFIEKALKFLDEKFYFNNLHHSIESGLFDSEEEMFEDFKNYIKGE